MSVKPSKRFVKHGILGKGEKWNPLIHSYGENIDDRNKNYDTNPPTTYYTPEEIKVMKAEIKHAICPICFETINDERCRMCENYHKFHNKCDANQVEEITECPTCRSKNIKPCIYKSNLGISFGNYDDVYSGGKRKHKSRKTNRKRKNRKNRKSKRRVSNYVRTLR